LGNPASPLSSEIYTSHWYCKYRIQSKITSVF